MRIRVNWLMTLPAEALRTMELELKLKNMEDRLLAILLNQNESIYRLSEELRKLSEKVSPQ